MSELARLLKDYQCLTEQLAALDMGWQPAVLTPVRITHQAQTLDRETLSTALEELAQARGWLLLPSKVLILPAPLDYLKQPPLQGEARLGEVRLRLTHQGRDRWTLHRFCIELCDAHEATHLAQEIRHQPDPRAPGPLRYQRLWQISHNQTSCASLALFDGFEETQA